MAKTVSIGRGSKAQHDSEPYLRDRNGIWRNPDASAHRSSDYDESGIAGLLQIQQKHFWYIGRHRFLSVAYKWVLDRIGNPTPSVLDAGAGAGGWVRYLLQRNDVRTVRLAAGDSSEASLAELSKVPGLEKAYQLDLYRLLWKDRWDCVFSLDVIEHLDDDRRALEELYRALKPGGYLVLTVPAFRFFWSYNDVFARHKRRYTKVDISKLAEVVGFQVVRQRYFMMFLSPLLWISRLRKPRVDFENPDEVAKHLEQTHRVPNPLLNWTLASAFSLESPFGWWWSFPWGASLLAVLRKPSS